MTIIKIDKEILQIYGTGYDHQDLDFITIKIEGLLTKCKKKDQKQIKFDMLMLGQFLNEEE